MKDLDEQLVIYCLGAIKESLQQQSITYAELAQRFEVAEVTIKRMLNQSDIAMSRLLALCDIAGLSLAKLLEDFNSQPPLHYYFSARQDEAFYQHPGLLHYFSELFYTGLSAEEIAAKYQLNEVSSYQYLRALENIELIELLPQNKVRFLVQAPLGFDHQSKVLKQQVQKSIEATCDKVMNAPDAAEHFFIAKPLSLSPQLYAKLIQELMKIIERFAQISEWQAGGSDDQGYELIMMGCPTTEEETSLIVNIPVDHFE
ncbi:helix-turn-helix transcriptional regulator [Pleionea sp. CnH1-48]|uniref:helix-turn-helix domain-containing protein n=1 Tax=Pleionea sp. CnH1-48 TaxID=2954494 RepID=UPI0020977137|nr:helix-turn-helix transcriptional regulator [Pleionea sp. CnH1-48]MCO7225728.1 helix-turn-helix transcriptional regulator [Pleionea sp. CnH1-48]